MAGRSKKQSKKCSKKHSVHKRRHVKGAGFFDDVGNLTKSAAQKLVHVVKQIQDIAPTVIAVAKFAKDIPSYVETAAEFAAPFLETAAEVAPLVAVGKRGRKSKKHLAGNYEIGGKKQSKKQSKKKRHVSSETLKILAMGRAKRAANLAKRR